MTPGGLLRLRTAKSTPLVSRATLAAIQRLSEDSLLKPAILSAAHGQDCGRSFLPTHDVGSLTQSPTCTRVHSTLKRRAGREEWLAGAERRSLPPDRSAAPDIAPPCARSPV